MSEHILVTDYLEEFCEALRDQLVEDEERWGDEWLRLSRDGQVTRISLRLDDYYNEWGKNSGRVPFPWLKAAGNILIGWIRDTYPELSEHWQ